MAVETRRKPETPVRACTPIFAIYLTGAARKEGEDDAIFPPSKASWCCVTSPEGPRVAVGFVAPDRGVEGRVAVARVAIRATGRPTVSTTTAKIGTHPSDAAGGGDGAQACIGLVTPHDRPSKGAKGGAYRPVATTNPTPSGCPGGRSRPSRGAAICWGNPGHAIGVTPSPISPICPPTSRDRVSPRTQRGGGGGSVSSIAASNEGRGSTRHGSTLVCPGAKAANVVSLAVAGALGALV